MYYSTIRGRLVCDACSNCKSVVMSRPAGFWGCDEEEFAVRDHLSTRGWHTIVVDGETKDLCSNCYQKYLKNPKGILREIELMDGVERICVEGKLRGN